MAKKIYVEEGVKSRLAKVFKCSNVMVWKALTFESNSKLARKIRYVALSQYGGVPSWKVAEMETTHEEGANTMTQTFSNRVKLVVEKGTGLVTILVDGEVDREEQVDTIPEFMELQSEVSRMALSL